jgi:hypothetical protein
MDRTVTCQSDALSHEVIIGKGEDNLQILCTNTVFNLFLIREEHRLSVYEKMLLRKIFGPKREVVMRLKKNLAN